MTRRIARYVAPFWHHHFINSPWYQALEEEACRNLNGRQYNVRDYWPDSHLQIVQSRIRPVTKSEAKAIDRTWAERTHVCIEFNLLEADVDALREAVASDTDSIKRYGVDNLVNMNLAFGLESFCDVLMFLVSITFAGSLNTEQPKVLVGRNEISRTPHRIVGIDRSQEEYDFLSAGIKLAVTLDQTLLWSRKCGGIWDGFATSPIEKAVSFLSHTFSGNESRSEVARLIWSTAGLEAIACDSGNSVSAQLRRRLPKLCDTIPFKNLPKLITEAYSFRSRLFHGDIPIMNCFNEDEVGYHDKRYDAQLVYYGRALQVILLAAVWKAIQLDSTNIAFEEEPIFT